MIDLDINSIFHPSDFSPSSETAFAHALRLAVFARAKLTIYHTNPSAGGPDWHDFPQVRKTLERWQILPAGSSKQDVVDLGVNIDKVLAAHRDAVHSILGYLERHSHDLLVLATHQYEGIERLTKRAIAEPVARESGEMTLFIPRDSDGFVSRDTGRVRLRNILIPIDVRPDPRLALGSAAALAALLGESGVSFHLLHVGDEQSAPPVSRPPGARGEWITLLRSGSVVEQILQTASEVAADLIVMATEGENGFLEALRGSTTERIVRSASCPVLAVPVNLAERLEVDDAILQPEDL